MALKSEIVETIRHMMPSNAEIQVVEEGNGFSVGVAWKLNDDLERPNKMSKTISIHVSSEVAQDFENVSGREKAEAYRRLSEFLSRKLAEFEPHHDTQKYKPPPVERWLIDTKLLFG